MTKNIDPIDTDLWQAMLDIAGEERSARFFAPPSSRLAHAWRQPAAIGGSNPVLSKAERHVVRFHREELALLLRKACVLELASDPAWSDVFVPPRPIDERLSLPDRAECVARAELARRRLNEEGPVTEAHELLRAVQGKRVGDASDLVQMAMVSELLIPTDTARIYVAMGLWRQGQLPSARRVLRTLLGQRMTAELEGYARQSLALVEWDLNDPESALMHARRAAAPDEPRALRFLLWFALCLQMELGDEALRAARGIDDRIKPDHPLITWFASSRTVAKLQSRQNSSTRQTIQRKLANAVGPATHRILHAIS